MQHTTEDFPCQMCVNKLEICCMVQVRGCVWVEACRRQDMMQKIRCRIPFSWFGWRFGNGPELPRAYFFLPPVHRHFICPHCRCVKIALLLFLSLSLDICILPGTFQSLDVHIIDMYFNINLLCLHLLVSLASLQLYWNAILNQTVTPRLIC